MIRKAAVAGSFYPTEPAELKDMVKGFCPPDTEKVSAKAIICPHAGYIYSGAVAGAVYASIEVPGTVILLGPNHTGMGAQAAVMRKGVWEIPTGELAVNEALAEEVISSCALFTEDTEAHIMEHSLEVQLPFLYHLNSEAKIVPVTLMGTNYEGAREMGEALAGVISAHKEKILVVVSSDMNHYESEAATRMKDNMAIQQVLALDAEGLLEVTSRKNITMCGAFPAAAAITAMTNLDACEAALVTYGTSGPVSGDMEHVVGYAGFTIN
ncbi:MAG: AmmeMemoRadiSam system protein B [Thermodesulfobacteriota bacterium]